MNLKIPTIILKIIQDVRKQGFECYLVGGCVRDLLLEATPNDWDITTNATPEEIQKIFPQSIYENQFGTVGVLTGSLENTLKIVEITTFRLEGKYSDKRHPDNIKYATTLEEDLSRRDFTINALALDIDINSIDIDTKKPIDQMLVECKLIDLFHGKDDLKKGIIRAVGDPDKRFEEDALRLIKTVRCATQLSFIIEPNTLESVKRKASNVQWIAGERIRDELIKIIMTLNAADGIRLLQNLELLNYIIPELTQTIDVTQNRHHIYTVWEHLWRSLDYAAKENYSLEVRLAALLHDIGKPRTKQGEGINATFLNHEILSAKITKHILTRLHFPNYILDKVVLLVRYHMFFYDPEVSTDASLRRLLAKVGKDNVGDLAKLREADRIGSGCPKALPFRLRHFMFRIDKILKDLEGETPSLKMLKVNGNDLMQNIGIEPGPKLGFILNILLEEVLDDIANNNQEYLLNRAKELNSRDIQELKELSEKAKDAYYKILDEGEAEIKRKYYV